MAKSEISNGIARISLYSDPHNKRVRIDDYTGKIKVVLDLIERSTPMWTEKIIIKSRKEEISNFVTQGYQPEAFVKGYFNGVDMYFLSKYTSDARSVNSKYYDEQQIIDKILKEEIPNNQIGIDEVLIATESDAVELTHLYTETFKFYPTPIFEPGYVLKTMKEGTLYVIIREGDKIVSAASAEIEQTFSNAELTDCASLPQAQGKGYMKKLLLKLEQILNQHKIHCLYTIARSESYSMNKVFYQLHYTYSGRMTNNCYIYSGMEDMNVWFKLI